MTLTEFLRARLDEDEGTARAHDEHQSGLTHPYDPSNPCDPARVLADVAAKRAVLAAHRPVVGRRGDVEDAPEGFTPGDVTCASCGDQGCCGHDEVWPCPTLLALAQVWAEHPDFDPAWRAPAGPAGEG